MGAAENQRMDRISEISKTQAVCWEDPVDPVKRSTPGSRSQAHFGIQIPHTTDSRYLAQKANPLKINPAEAGRVRTSDFTIRALQAEWLQDLVLSFDLFRNNPNACAKRAKGEDGARTIFRCSDSTYCCSLIVSHAV